MNRQERVSIQKKQERASITDGVPTLNELTDGIPVYRLISGDLVQYIKHRNILYKKVLDKA
jgi:hypothetical protein|tara:strand:- start:549 stop:731 length:183 start_codon:yes stop_codon:yes gene_type:complete